MLYSIYVCVCLVMIFLSFDVSLTGDTKKQKDLIDKVCF